MSRLGPIYISAKLKTLQKRSQERSYITGLAHFYLVSKVIKKPVVWKLHYKMAYSAITNPVIEKKNFWVVWAVECTQKWFFLIYNGLLINRITRYFMKGWDVWVSNNRLLNGLTRIYFKQEILHFNQCDTLWRITCRIYYIFIFSFYFWLKCGLF